MAMVNCRECGKQVSDQAKACPHCGALVAMNDRERIVRVLMILFVLAAGAVYAVQHYGGGLP
jgi:DNA-directed RNA polymerase subunit RPC12/RpoP